MDLGFNLAQSNRDLKDPTSRQNFGDTSGLLCKNDLIPCPILLIEQKVLHLAFVSFEYLAAELFLAKSPPTFAPKRLSCRKILSQFQIGAKKLTETN